MMYYGDHDQYVLREAAQQVYQMQILQAMDENMEIFVDQFVKIEKWYGVVAYG